MLEMERAVKRLLQQAFDDGLVAMLADEYALSSAGCVEVLTDTLREMQPNFLLWGKLKLRSGRESSFKFDLDAFTDAEVTGFANLISLLVGSFGSVEGVPRGGLRLAAALKVLCDPASSTHLVVDDVLTTGGSLIKVAKARTDADPEACVKGAVMIARGPCPPWVKAVLHLAPELRDA